MWPGIFMGENMKTKIASLELGRIIAILAIIGLHCQMALTYWQIDDIPWVGYLLNQMARFAVPLFFLISGYLIQPKLTSAPFETLGNYAKPLLKIWLVWSALSLLMPFNFQVVAEHGYLAERQGYWGYLAQTPLNSLLEGGLVHLWFLPALIIAVAVVALFVHFQRQHWLLPIAALLYLYGVLAGSYQPLTDLASPFFTRNGPFFSTLLVAIGFMIREKNVRVSSAIAGGMFLVGLLVHLGQAYGLMGYDIAFNGHDFLFGTELWATGLFLLLLNYPQLGQHPLTFALSPYVLGVYVCHLLVIILLMNIAGILGFEGLSRDLFIYPMTIGLSVALVWGLNHTPLQRYLLR
ncbi:TPA: fucose 4-O-acetylase [Vibrio vulnificus]|uniref:Fucose 4-O-acetylase n=2 Tax=Vibrio vulnificus TaxID=672 RepID=A0A2S3QY11_VIBVL|nr:acyltransferase family protein [Vibrio vulnificus]POB43804.1 fucose 4-O-acetylase [Vibrio vulnificus]RAH28079.1 fucose 4-O-acetylase [Vibrio vulnificus]RZP62076.1 fucose 4-O-acetylase [Vibrio vulnificus]RZR09649.1 fucose 4-O-acetylase [Vibrio vulnificus]